MCRHLLKKSLLDSDQLKVSEEFLQATCHLLFSCLHLFDLKELSYDFWPLLRGSMCLLRHNNGSLGDDSLI